MSVETKKMANSIVAAGGSFGERMKSWPERIKTFYNDVRTRNAQGDGADVQGSARPRPPWSSSRSFIFALYFVDDRLRHSTRRDVICSTYFKAH